MLKKIGEQGIGVCRRLTDDHDKIGHRGNNGHSQADQGITHVLKLLAVDPYGGVLERLVFKSTKRSRGGRAARLKGQLDLDEHGD